MRITSALTRAVNPVAKVRSNPIDQPSGRVNSQPRLATSWPGSTVNPIDQPGGRVSSQPDRSTWWQGQQSTPTDQPGGRVRSQSGLATWWQGQRSTWWQTIPNIGGVVIKIAPTPAPTT
jgi:hypothetical protein